MILQEKIIRDYLEFCIDGTPTLRKIAHDTGINTTRVFRIMQGNRMRLDEYEVFKKKIERKKGTTKLQQIIVEIQDTFSAKDIHEIEDYLKRRLKIVSLTKMTKRRRRR